MRDYKLNVNIIQNGKTETKIFKQFDKGNEIEIELYDNEKLIEENRVLLKDETVFAYWLNAEGTEIQRNCKIRDGNIVATTDREILSVVGPLYLECLIIDGGVETTTMRMEFRVMESINGGRAIVQDPRYYSDLVTELLELSGTIDGKIAEIKKQAEAIVANVTNGNESATNSEVVLARQGNISLGINLSKMKESIKKALSSIFIEEIRTAKNTDFIGEGTVNINNNILSVTGETNQYSYIACDSDVLEFTLEDTKYILLGVGSKTFTTLNISTVGEALGRLMDWTSNSYVVRADNLITKSFSQGDKVRVEKIEEGYKIYQNGNLVLELNKSNYSSVTGWENSKLGFFLVKDKGSNLASNIKILDYNVDQISSNSAKISRLEALANSISNEIYEEKETYEEKVATANDFVLNYAGEITINDNVLNSTVPTNAYNIAILKGNKIKFNILDTNYIVLGTTENGAFTTICLKHTNANYIGGIADYNLDGTVKIKTTLSIEACASGDEIIAEATSTGYVFEKNGANWFSIERDNYSNVLNWTISKFGFLIIPSIYSNLAQNIIFNSPKIIKSSLRDDVNELKEKVGSMGSSTNQWNGKKAVFLGDSLTYGYGLSDRTKTYCYTIKEELGLREIKIYGISGSTIANEQNSMAERYAEMDDDADLVCVFGGTNDYGMHPTSIGEKTDTNNTTFYGGLNMLMAGLMAKYPSATIVFFTPLHRQFSKTNMSDDYTKNSEGYILNDYRDAIIDRCMYYSVPYIDIYTISGLNPNIAENKAAYFLDIAHLNVAGHKRLGLKVSYAIKAL